MPLSFMDKGSSQMDRKKADGCFRLLLRETNVGLFVSIQQKDQTNDQIADLGCVEIYPINKKMGFYRFLHSRWLD